MKNISTPSRQIALQIDRHTPVLMALLALTEAGEDANAENIYDHIRDSIRLNLQKGSLDVRLTFLEHRGLVETEKTSRDQLKFKLTSAGMALAEGIRAKMLSLMGLKLEE